MGQTNPKYPIMEVVIACEDCASLTSGHERKLVGDIIGFRPITAPQAGAVGSKEMSNYLWLRISGLEENEWGRMTESIYEDFDAEGFPTGDTYDKRRYCIPFERLEQLVPGFSITDAKDTTKVYQPFCNVDEDSPYPFIAKQPVLDAHGLIFDKLTGKYL